MTLSSEQRLGLATSERRDSEIRREKYKSLAAGYQDVKYSKRQQAVGYDFNKGADGNDAFPDAWANIAQLAVSTPLNRLGIVGEGRGIVPLGDQSSEYAALASAWWLLGKLDSAQGEIHGWALRDAQSVMFVEWDTDNDMPIFTPHEAWDGESDTGVRVFFDQENADQVEFISKFWKVSQVDQFGNVLFSADRLNIYAFDDKGRSTIERYISTQSSSTDTVQKDVYTSQDEQAGIGDGNSTSYQLMSDEEVSNETGKEKAKNPEILPIDKLPVALFNWKQSEVARLAVLQKVLTKTYSDVDVAIDFNGQPALAIEGLTPGETQTEGGKSIKYEPGSLIGGKANRIDPADLKRLWDGGVTRWVETVTMVMGWPTFLLSGEGTTFPSGTALKLAEAPLVAQVEDMQIVFTDSWREVFDIAALWSNALGSKNVSDDAQIGFKWKSPTTQNVIEDQEIQVRTMNDAGFSMQTIWAQVYGMTEDEIIEEFKKLEQEAILDPDNTLKIAQILQALTLAGFTFEQMATLLDGIAGITKERLAALVTVEGVVEEAEALARNRFTDGTVQ